MTRFDDFLRTRRSPETARVYRRCILQFTKSPDDFLAKAEKDRVWAEKTLIGYFVSQKTAGASRRGKYHAIKTFLEFNDIDLKWKKISSILPVAKRVAIDRAPTKEEIAKVLSFCDVRGKMIVLCMVSGGFRVGAWDWLNVGDVTFLEGGISKLRIYRGEAEEYFTFVTPEATSAIQDYLDQRRRAGENITSNSPLARNRWDLEDGRKRVDPRIVRRLTMMGVEHVLFRAWWHSGIRTEASQRHEFKQAHGFRKFFKSNAPVCKEHGNLDAEVLMGHFLSYFKPSEKHLQEYYSKCVPYLSIDEKFKLKEELQVEQKENAEKIRHLEALVGALVAEKAKQALALDQNRMSGT